MVRLSALESERSRAWPDFVVDIALQVTEMAAGQWPERGDRVASINGAEPARHKVAHFFGDGAVAGDLTADNRDDSGHTVAPRVIAQRVFARDFAFGDMLDAHQRANPRPGVV